MCHVPVNFIISLPVESTDMLIFQIFVHSSQVASIPEANSFRCFVSNKLLGGLGRRSRGDATDAVSDGSW